MIPAPYHPITDFDSIFEICSASSLFKRLGKRDVGGIYSIAIKGLHSSLQAAGYKEESGMPEVWSGEHFHAYVGETYSLKFRMEDHLYGLHDGQGFRKSLSIIIGRSGTNLTRFLMDHAKVGYRYFDCMGDIEAYLIKHTACPLNLRGKGQSKFAKKLRQLRRNSSVVLGATQHQQP